MTKKFNLMPVSESAKSNKGVQKTLQSFHAGREIDGCTGDLQEEVNPGKQLLPQARTSDIIIQELNKEVLVYDLKTHKAFNLNEMATTVYQACDGKTSFDNLKRKHKFTDELIFLALDQLKTDNLLVTDDSEFSFLKGLNRREAIRKAGLASLIALPFIKSVVAPTATMAASVASCIANGSSASGSGSTGAACVSDARTHCCSGFGIPNNGNCVLTASGLRCTCDVTCS